jgi:hypothetical protein
MKQSATSFSNAIISALSAPPRLTHLPIPDYSTAVTTPCRPFSKITVNKATSAGVTP